MKKISLFTVLGLIASFALADTIYYPANTYKVDGKVQFISTNRPTMVVVTTNGNEVSDIVTRYDMDQTSGTIIPRIQALENVVGDEEEGLVKDVGDLQDIIGDDEEGLVKDINDLQTTVGDATTGLVKTVNDLGTDVGTLKTTVGNAESGLVKAVNDLNTDVGALKTTVGDANSGLVKDVTDLKNANYVNTVKVQGETGESGDITFVPDENIQITNSGATFTIKAIEQPVRTLSTITIDSSNASITSTNADLTTSAEQFYTWSGNTGKTVTVNIGTGGTGSNVGYLTLYLDENYAANQVFEIDDTNIIGCPAIQFWTSNTDSGSQRSTWKIELELVPGVNSWYFKKASEFTIPTAP